MKIEKSQRLHSATFYKVAKIMHTFGDDRKDQLEAFVNGSQGLLHKFEQDFADIAKAKRSINQEIRNHSKNHSSSSLESQERDMAQFLPELRGVSFIAMIYNVFERLGGVWNNLIQLAENAVPQELEIMSYDRSFNSTNSVNDLNERQFRMMEQELNASAVEQFISTMKILSEGKAHLLEDIDAIAKSIERYYQWLQQKHNDGFKIFRDPIITDIANSIYENIDSHGEIESGKDPNSISAYTEARAFELIDLVKSEMVQLLVEKPDNFNNFICENINIMLSCLDKLNDIISQPVHDTCLAINFKPRKNISAAQVNELFQFIKDCNPASIKDKSDEKLLSPAERQSVAFKNQTIEEIVKRISDTSVSNRELLTYILERKRESRKQRQEENTFYVCRISSGNPFQGKAPGALEVIDAERPNSKIDDILGSGYDDVRTYLRGTEGAIKWNDLFLATSPRKKVDRQHLLMVGPAGCHRKGQKILMFDGSLKLVEDIRVGELLMGPDSKPRTVLKLHSGVEEMVEILPVDGKPWAVNKSHILSLSSVEEEIVDASVTEYIDWPAEQKAKYLLFRIKVYSHSSKHIRVPFTLKHLPPEEYFGFTVDSDHRYLLDDFTVTHNCGKTELMRSVATEKNSVAIFAQGSDFLTCWKGEDQKNPKRLFEQALKIQKDSKKHVYIMIDEIDSVLNNDRSHGETNLSLEFQILMDGMVSYPHISVWGATNFPERIPLPMIRRFKVVIVGELGKEDTTKLLQHYIGKFLPHSITKEGWDSAVHKLEGATGDVIAKVGESLWRNKLTAFVAEDKDAATKMTDLLNKEAPFNIREFDEKTRHNFLQELKKHICITNADLLSNIDTALKSVGIRTEIDSARETYAKAKRFVAQIDTADRRSGIIL